MTEMEIVIAPAGGQRQADVFTAHWGDILLATSRTPFFDSARKLLEIGAKSANGSYGWIDEGEDEDGKVWKGSLPRLRDLTPATVGPISILGRGMDLCTGRRFSKGVTGLGRLPPWRLVIPVGSTRRFRPCR